MWLIEVNAAPAVTERLRRDFAREFIDTVIEPTFGPSSGEASTEVLQAVSTNEVAPAAAVGGKAEAPMPVLFDLIAEL